MRQRQDLDATQGAAGKKLPIFVADAVVLGKPAEGQKQVALD